MQLHTVAYDWILIFAKSPYKYRKLVHTSGEMSIECGLPKWQLTTDMPTKYEDYTNSVTLGMSHNIQKQVCSLHLQFHSNKNTIDSEYDAAVISHSRL